MRMSISLSASMKPDALVVHQLRAEHLAAAGVSRGDVVRAPRRAQPAHAMRQPRRRQPHLGVAEALARLAQDVARRHAQIVEPHHRVAAREGLVQAVHRAHDLDARLVHVGEEHRRRAVLALRHDDGEARAIRAGDEPLVAVDHPVIAVLHRRGVQRRGIGPAPGAGSVMQKQERMSPLASGRSQRSFCSGVATTSSRWMLASSGAKMCIATEPSSE